MEQREDLHPDGPPPPLSRNLISYIGWIISFVMGAVLIVLVVTDLFFIHSDNPYNSMVTYIMLPGFFLFGVGLIFFGIAREWKRRHSRDPSTYPELPHIDLNKPWQRRRLVMGISFCAVFFTMSAVGTYQAYHFTESTAFCGVVCHQVMKPEYTAYQFSPHARVACTECHIGPGAEWYVRSKMSGLRQVWAVLTDDYHMPIETPIENLRPARGTCEQCHWPEKFSHSVEKEIWHFSPDKANTATRYNLLLRIGGGSPEVGLGHGIHQHISPGFEVYYWPRDEKRLDIPWVEFRKDGEVVAVYKTEDCPDPLPEDAEIRLMDCIDCHNRPSHIYRSPNQLVDFYMASGALDASLPYLKRYATDVLEREYPDTETALATIEKVLSERYESWIQGPEGEKLVGRNIEWLQELYTRNFFPEQKVKWRQYPNHVGHYEFPGCYRCHDDRHRSDDGRVISNDCNLCHEILDQAEGELAYGPITYEGGEFRHPRNLDDVWRGHNCTDCHGIGRDQREEVMGKVSMADGAP